MKKTILTCLVGLTSIVTFAQKISVSGVVNDKQGKSVAFAFIKDAKHNYATFTDTYGAFNLKVDTVDRLIVSASAFITMTVKISDPQSVGVTLASDGTVNAKLIDPDAFKEKISTEGMTRNVASGYIAKENSLHGTRYFFDTWVHGYVITQADSIKENSNYLFNYGKMDGSLLFTDDGKTMKEIDGRLIKMFVLFDNGGQSYTFEKIPAIDPNHFVQVLAVGSNYKIYKQLNTKFIPNNYVSNGMTSNGNNYDEIKDEPVYYAVKVPGGAPIKFTLRSKSIKTVFAADVAKVSKYLSDHDTDIDDRYLKGLGDYLNN
ncbi:hypothetical protein [Mucilaginibacter sp.]|uniref:hypothetical protein n=1 Tax=Mucilaginibacter sp. TaxID=1882438 RepID=UPI0026305C36|nr:hypothetical protein [Mucilaginibacter sp.]MDB5031018.1 hypothetical protein [Mucilaginibacter sp.]